MLNPCVFSLNNQLNATDDVYIWDHSVSTTPSESISWCWGPKLNRRDWSRHWGQRWTFCFCALNRGRGVETDTHPFWKEENRKGEDGGETRVWVEGFRGTRGFNKGLRGELLVQTPPLFEIQYSFWSAKKGGLSSLNETTPTPETKVHVIDRNRPP